MYLNCHSYYSLRYGTMSIDTLLDKAQENGIKALALTDINNTTGVVDFVKECKERNIKPIVGVEFRNDNNLLYICLAKNREGFREIAEFLSRCNFEKSLFPDEAPIFNNVYVIYPYGIVINRKLRDNEFIGIYPSSLRKLDVINHNSSKQKRVALFPVSFAEYDDHTVHLCLRAINENTLVTKLDSKIIAGKYEVFLPIDEVRALYSDFMDIIKNTEKILDECEIDFDFSGSRNKKTFTSSHYEDLMLLEKLVKEGIIYRYKKSNTEIEQRVRHELEVIDKMGFASYFLIAWDLIRYARSRGFSYVGRGSGANSIVAYCLQITNVDPIELNLYFERFINPKRTNPPDFDIDFSWNERDYIISYMFDKYGWRHTALICAISTFRDRSVFRELGKVNGLSKQEIDLLIRNPNDIMFDNQIIQRMYEIGNKILDFPNIRSIHAGGVIVSEEPITYYTAFDLPPKGFPTTQWDMYTAETLGYEKFDVLSQRGIGHIKDCADIIKQNYGITLDLNDIEKFKKDEKTIALLKNGEALGCFYIESPATRGLLKKLKCDNYLTLVAASSIIRPGVAKSGMMKEYIRRYKNPSETKYLHPMLGDLLSETFGIMVYQEDVIKVAHFFAGLDLAEADILRRAMSGKYRSHKEFEKIAKKFYDNCIQKGYSDDLIKEVWRQMESFAGYSFSKAHSASYAVESFQSLYLKAHFPIEHMVAVINNFGGFYQTWVYVHEARRWGASIHLPCVNNSFFLTTVKDKDVWLGFVLIQNLETQLAQRIEKERIKNGLFKDVLDFIKRTGATKEQMIILIRTGCFRFTGKNKKQLLWEIHGYLSSQNTKIQFVQKEIFNISPRKYELPILEHSVYDDFFDEMEFLGFSVSLNPFDVLQTKFRGEVMASNMLNYVGKKVRMLGNLVTIKNVRTSTNEWMHFATFIDVKGDFFDTVHFSNSLKKYRFAGQGIYLLLGIINEEFGFPSLIVEKMAKMPIVQQQF